MIQILDIHSPIHCSCGDHDVDYCCSCGHFHGPDSSCPDPSPCGDQRCCQS